VVGAGFVADGLLAPRRMVFKPGAGANEKSGEKPSAISLAPPDEGAGPTAGPTAAAAGFGFLAKKNGDGAPRNARVARVGIGSIAMPALAPRLRAAPTRGRPKGVASRVASRAPPRPRGMRSAGAMKGFSAPRGAARVA
jgi:hypothetical protein